MIAIESKQLGIPFIDRVDHYMEKAKEAILDRFKYQCSGNPSDFDNLFSFYKGGDEVRDGDLYEALKHGSLSLGFIGLAEAIKILDGEYFHKNEELYSKALGIITHMREKTDQYAKEENLNFTLLGTPAEGYSYRSFEKCKSMFPEDMPHDKGYFTNSFHIPVWEEVDIFEKIRLEAPFHKLCNAGHISYFELGGEARDNIDGIEQIIDYAVENDIGYFSLNHCRQECQNPDCGASYAVSVEEEGKPCRICGGETEMIAIITGYLVGSTNSWNKGKRAELKNRIEHTK